MTAPSTRWARPSDLGRGCPRPRRPYPSGHPGSPRSRRDNVGRVVGVETAAGPLSAATVVLAAGVATAALAAPLGIRVPVDPSPATLVSSALRPVWSAPWSTPRTFDLRQVDADRLIAGRRLARAHSRRRPVHLPRRRERRAAQQPGRRTHDAGRRRADRRPGRCGARALRGRRCHSAVTLAAAVGRLVARELVDGAGGAITGGLPSRPLLGAGAPRRGRRPPRRPQPVGRYGAAAAGGGPTISPTSATNVTKISPGR